MPPGPAGLTGERELDHTGIENLDTLLEKIHPEGYVWQQVNLVDYHRLHRRDTCRDIYKAYRRLPGWMRPSTFVGAKRKTGRTDQVADHFRRSKGRWNANPGAAAHHAA